MRTAGQYASQAKKSMVTNTFYNEGIIGQSWKLVSWGVLKAGGRMSDPFSFSQAGEELRVFVGV
jgi:hypothetical protein